MSKDETELYADRRAHVRYDAKLDVDYRHGSGYLFATSANVSALGIFLVTRTPLPKGAVIELRFRVPEGSAPIDVLGEVTWVDGGSPSRQPGMGIRFCDPSEETRTRIKALIRTIAYLE